MGEDTSKPKVEQSDSEAFDIAVRRDDTKSLDEMSGDDVAQNDANDAAPFVEEKEVTTPEQSEETTRLDEPALEESFKSDDEPVNAPEPVVAQAQPAAPAVIDAAPVASVQHYSNSPGTLVLQWLSYAFWGWFGASLSVLAGITFGYFISGSDEPFIGDNIAYSLAAVFVMLVIALVTDFFYARREPVAKKGAASVIMLIHVVLYMLTVVGALIAIVFSAIRMLITVSPVDSTNGAMVSMLTAAVIGIVFGAVSLRALFAGKKRGVRKMFWLLMSMLALGFVVASIAGPAMKANSTKNDRLIESALPSLVSSIQSYVRTNDKLPASLSDVKSTYSYSAGDEFQAMIDRNLVTYKANTQPAKTSTKSTSTTSAPCTTSAECIQMGVSGASSSSVSKSSPTEPTTFYYQLCVTYKESKTSKYYSSRESYDGGVSTMVNTNQHAKGNVCYDLSAKGRYSYATY